MPLKLPSTRTLLVGAILILFAGGLISLWFTHAPMPWEKTSSGLTSTNWLETREQEADKTVWAKEMLAEKCGRTFEDLWDKVNASTNKWKVIAGFSPGQVVLPHWGPVQKLPHDIELREGTTVGQKLPGVDWKPWVEDFAGRGWELDNVEFRHVAFETDSAGQPSKSHYYFAARLTNQTQPERAILEGDLIIGWSVKTNSGDVAVEEWDASRLKLKTRVGPPFFSKILDETIAPSRSTGFIDPLIVYDLDGDGFPEIILAAANLVYHRTARDHYEQRPLCRFPIESLTTAIMADFDGDGFADLLAANGRGLFLFKGSSTGTFDAPPRLVWTADPPLKNAMVMTCGDIEHTGHLDVFVGQYKVPLLGQVLRPHYYDANDGWPSHLLHNDGQGNFTEITESAGLGAKRWRRTYSASFVDLDNDGNLDLAVISDFAGLDLYRNDGHGHFADVTREWVPESHGFGMACAFADFNVDGRLDLLMIGMPSPTVDRLQSLNLWRPYSDEDRLRRPAMTFGNRLLLARTNGGFEQTPLSASIARSGWSWGCSAFDFDNDGFPDVYIANGLETKQSVRDYESEFWLHNIFIDESVDDASSSRYLIRKANSTRGGSWSYGGYEKNRLFLNQNGQSFEEVGHLGGVSLEQDSRNVVAEDLDGDGKVDLVLTTFEIWPQHRQTLKIFKNELPSSGNWIGFRFKSGQAGISPIGTEVTLHYQSRTGVRQIVTGDSHRSQHPPTLHFGLGDAVQVESCEVKWPNGKTLIIRNPPLNQYSDLIPTTGTQ